MLQLGIRLHDMRPGSLAERAAWARGQGFSCVHLALEKTIPGFKLEPGKLTAGFGKYIRDIFASHDVDVAVLGCYKNLAHPDRAELQRIQENYIAHLRMAVSLGCSVVGTETGAPNAEYQYEPQCHTEMALQTFLHGLEPVVEAAEKLGVLLAIEPVWNHIVWNPQVARRVIREVASPNLRIIFDPVNLLSGENYQDRERVIGEAIEQFGEYVEVVHLKDFQVQGEKLSAVAPGTGLMDYKPLLAYLKQEKYGIQATLENTIPENAVAARKYLEEIYAEV
ncbi:Sugar phosphate isomerase/epimerase [Selenomonas ruminantium]|uniref:Sugar phosphate isomerase/epimerase n=1 Tax=Selenomonas ruminantium TaxID=971 RepID=A0A1M6TCI2_SELRU|nr:sugar phosphate isomerase/epimerase family protein [Selenomonas ruminantium]SHK54680.1 Sugar phosphate isomerase/epimerase [Selenomonas ruminantium]